MTLHASPPKSGGLRRLLNRSHVRQAFHVAQVRVPHGFFDELEQTLHGALRHAEAPREDEEPGDPGDLSYLKVSQVKETLRSLSGKRQVRSEDLLALAGVVARTVAKAVGRRRTSLPPVEGVPSTVVRKFLRSRAHRDGMTFAAFARSWQTEEFRKDWRRIVAS